MVCLGWGEVRPGSLEWEGGRGEDRVDVAGAFLLHCFIGGDGEAELGRWRIDGGEGEDVEEE